MKFQFIAFLLIFLASIGSAFALPTISGSNHTYFLETGVSANEVYTVTNPNASQTCFDVQTESPTSSLELTAATTHFCLNASETTQITVSIHALPGLADGSYTGKVRFISNGNIQEQTIPVSINQAPSITFTVPQTTACSEAAVQSIAFQNNTATSQTVSISAESEAILPYFSQGELTLNANSGQTATLRFPINSSFEPGQYNFTIKARTQTETIVKKGSLIVNECNAAFDDIIFSLTAPNRCTTLSPGDSKSVSLTLENKSAKSVLFELKTAGILDETLPFETVTINANSNQSISLEIFAPKYLDYGFYDTTVQATAGGMIQSINVCSQIIDPLDAQFLQNNFLVPQGKDFNASLQVYNRGNEGKRISVGIQSVENPFTVLFSETEFTLGGPSSRLVRTRIRVPFDAPLGAHALTVQIQSNDRTIVRTLYFTVEAGSIEPPTPIPPATKEEKYLRFLSYPISADISAGQTRTLVFVIGNDANVRLTNLSLEIENKPADLSFEPPGQLAINSNGSVQTIGRITANQNAEPKTYRVRFSVSNDSYIGYQTVEIRVQPAEPEPAEPEPQTPIQAITGFFTGLFSFGSASAWLIAAAILVLVLVIVFFEAILENAVLILGILGFLVIAFAILGIGLGQPYWSILEAALFLFTIALLVALIREWLWVIVIGIALIVLIHTAGFASLEFIAAILIATCVVSWILDRLLKNEEFEAAILLGLLLFGLLLMAILMIPVRLGLALFAIAALLLLLFFEISLGRQQSKTAWKRN